MSERDTPFRLRAVRVQELEAWFHRFFAHQARWHSALVCVAQHWADEAEDAVHATVVLSTRPTPRWPLPLEAPDELRALPPGADLEDVVLLPWRLESELGRFPWDAAGTAIRAFQAFCEEVGAQELPERDLATPVLLFRRDGDGLTVHLVGEPLRPWLDLPTTSLPGWLDADADDDDGPARLSLPPGRPTRRRRGPWRCGAAGRCSWAWPGGDRAVSDPRRSPPATRGWPRSRGTGAAAPSARGTPRRWP